MSITTYNPNTLPVDDNINAYSFCVDLNGQYFVQKGRMIAYYGQMKFESLNAGPLSGLIAAHFSAPLYHNAGFGMMMSATMLGMTAQDVADLVAYLRQAE